MYGDAIVLLMRCSFRYFCAKISYPEKLWTAVRGFLITAHRKLLIKKLKLAPFCSSLDGLADGIIFCKCQYFHTLVGNHRLLYSGVLPEIEAIICSYWKVL